VLRKATKPEMPRIERDQFVRNVILHKDNQQRSAADYSTAYTAQG
jgi:hypothetical protein